MANRLIIGFTIVLAAVYAYGIGEIRVPQLGDPLGPRTFPMLICAGLVIAAVMLTSETFFMKLRPQEATEPVSREEPPAPPQRWVVPFAVAVTAIYFLAFEPLGYPLATSLFLIALTSVFRRGRWVGNIVTSVLFSFGTYYVFTTLLHVRLPRGVLPV